MGLRESQQAVHQIFYLIDRSYPAATHVRDRPFFFQARYCIQEPVATLYQPIDEALVRGKTWVGSSVDLYPPEAFYIGLTRYSLHNHLVGFENAPHEKDHAPASGSIAIQRTPCELHDRAVSSIAGCE